MPKTPAFAPALLSCLLALVPAAGAQEAESLVSHYSGKADWDADSGVLTFATSGQVDFGLPDYQSSIWQVPASVKTIVIGRGVRVTAAFTTHSSLNIQGQGPGQSEIYGTPTPALLHDAGLDGSGKAITYSAVYAVGKGVTVNITGVRSLDPLSFHFTGYMGAVLHINHVAAIDDRGGFYNHSDGVQGGAGTTVADSYFETGDDIIKIYADMTVTDTQIKMIRNAVPIQFGWGSYGSGAHGTLKNVRIFGDSGRNDDFPIINAQAGVYTKTVDIGGLEIDNPHATLFRFNDPTSRFDITITKARINVGQYGPVSNAAGTRTVCGSQQPKTQYDCATLSAAPGGAAATATGINGNFLPTISPDAFGQQ